MLQLKEHSLDKNPIWLVESEYRIGADESCQIRIAAAKGLCATMSVYESHVSLRLEPGVDVKFASGTIANNQTLGHGSYFYIENVKFEILDPKRQIEEAEFIPTESNTKISWYLNSINPNSSITRIPLEGKVVIGRSPDCDVVIDSPKLSRRHAELNLRGNALVVLDLGSSNGTFLNGNKIVRAEAKEGDKVCFDNLCFVLAIGASEEDFDKTNLRPSIGLKQQLKNAQDKSNKANTHSKKAGGVANKSASLKFTAELTSNKEAIEDNAANQEDNLNEIDKPWFWKLMFALIVLAAIFWFGFDTVVGGLQ